MRARFITDTATVNVNPVQITGRIGVKSNSVTGKVNVKTVLPTTDHDKLNNRALPDQHPISAITGLQEALVEVSDKTFVFEQSIASDTWHIQHTLNKRASCVAVDSAGEVQIPDEIKYISDNEIIATFLAPFAGKAYLN